MYTLPARRCAADVRDGQGVTLTRTSIVNHDSRPHPADSASISSRGGITPDRTLAPRTFAPSLGLIFSNRLRLRSGTGADVRDGDFRRRRQMSGGQMF